MTESVFILIYLVLINLLAFALYGIDKRLAVKHLRRIPEYVLLVCALIGGALGAMTGMFYFRHKTQHYSFTLFVPLFFLIHLFLLCYYISTL